MALSTCLAGHDPLVLIEFGCVPSRSLPQPSSRLGALGSVGRDEDEEDAAAALVGPLDAFGSRLV